MKVYIHQPTSLQPTNERDKLPESELQEIVSQFNSQLTIPNFSLSELTGYSFAPDSKGVGINYKSVKSSIFVTLFCSVSDYGNVVLDAACTSPKHEKVLTTQFINRDYIQSLDDLNSKVARWLEKNHTRLIGKK